MLWESFSNLKDFPDLESNDAKHVSVTFGLDDGRLDSSDEETSTLDTEPYFWFRLEYENDAMKGVFKNRVSINVVPVETESSHPVNIIICLASQLIRPDKTQKT
jgi:hypothetical protein